jgi:hypothetical protein
VLAYTAAALPTLLLLSQSGLAMGEVLTTETLAVEIVQTLVGSIGLVASVAGGQFAGVQPVLDGADELFGLERLEEHDLGLDGGLFGGEQRGDPLAGHQVDDGDAVRRHPTPKWVTSKPHTCRGRYSTQSGHGLRSGRVG